MSHSTPGPAEYDLHLHTFWSYDATAQVRPYFERARELGLRCIAITEHHNIDSAADVSEVATEFPEIRWIPSAELSVNTSIGAVDLLCYNLPRQPQGALAEVLEEYNAWQRAAGEAITSGMQALGFDFTQEEQRKVLATYRPEKVIARHGVTHCTVSELMKAFLRLGYIKSPEEFAELNRRRRQAVPTLPYPAVERVVPAVKAAGGTVVIAHPAGYFEQKNRSRMDQLREECDLDGIECAHRTVSPELTDFYREYCLQHGLVSTAGSDCHHPEDVLTPVTQWGHTPDRRFACHIGKPEWLDELLERLG